MKETQQSPSLSAESTALEASSDHDLRVACYCEENAWRVAYRHLHNDNLGRSDDRDWKYYVVFISNNHKCCPMFMQRAIPKDNQREYVCWDYHVIVMRSMVQHSDDTIVSEILDVDTWITPYQSPLAQYLDESFPHASDPNFNKQYLPLFNVVRAEDYIKEFYSDRMHMFQNGKWNSPPPVYPPIMNGLVAHNNNGGDNHELTGSNLESYISMIGEAKRVFSLAEMYERSKLSNKKGWTE